MTIDTIRTIDTIKTVLLLSEASLLPGLVTLQWCTRTLALPNTLCPLRLHQDQLTELQQRTSLKIRAKYVNFMRFL